MADGTTPIPQLEQPRTTYTSKFRFIDTSSIPSGSAYLTASGANDEEYA